MSDDQNRGVYEYYYGIENPQHRALAEVATGDGSGPSAPGAAPPVPPTGGAPFLRDQMEARLDQYWKDLHCILWLDWDLGRPDSREKAKAWVLDHFLPALGVIESAS
jgi:hypothetical protein